jgi:hypothetical protein
MLVSDHLTKVGARITIPFDCGDKLLKPLKTFDLVFVTNFGLVQ